MLQRFSHVIHITSTVSGDIQEGKDALDANWCYPTSRHIVWGS